MSLIEAAVSWLRALPLAYQIGLIVVALLFLWLGLMLAVRK